MNALTEHELLQALSKIGISSGDILLVHSDLRGFRIPAQTKTRNDILQFYYDTFEKILGKEGTLAVPAYFYEYARFGLPFDVDKSPVSDPLGSFSQWFINLPQRVRSCNPLQSIAAVGKHAHELSGSNSLSGYGVTSPWHKLRKLKGKIVFLGAPVQSMTYVHYVEQHYGVPHLYFKIYPYPVIKKGKELSTHTISAVRYLDYAITYDLAAYKQQLEKEGVLHTHHVQGVPISAVDAEAAYQIGISQLDQNPYFFLKQPPQFIPGKIPTDGITGPS